MVPPLCYKHNDIHSKLINALHFSRALENKFPAPASSRWQIRALRVPAGHWGDRGTKAMLLPSTTLLPASKALDRRSGKRKQGYT